MDPLDLRHLKCPLPALMAKKALDAAPGAILTVLADDPLAVVDIPHMCAQEGHAVLESQRRDGFHEFRLQARTRA